MGVFSSVECCEVHGTRSGSHTQDRSEYSVQLQVLEANREALITDLFDNPWPSDATARVVDIQERPIPTAFTEDGQEIVYPETILTVKYSNNPDDGSEPTGGGAPDGADRISETLTPNVEFITLDPKLFLWSGDGETLLESESPGKQIFSTGIVRTHYGVTSLSSTLFSEIGKVNSAAYTSAILGRTFAIETLLYTPPELSRTIKTSGVGAWTLKLTFLEKPQGWNTFWRAKTQQWEEIIVAITEEVYKNFPLGDFSALLY